MNPAAIPKINEQNQTVEDKERVEHASDIIGDWGPYQLRILLLTTIMYVVSPFHNKALVFYAPRIGFWCKRPDGYENATLQTCSSYENPNVSCTKWEYDLGFYKSTIIDEYDLVCDRAWLVSAAQSCFQIGYFISSIIVGIFSDRFGRLTALKLCVALEIIVGIFLAFSPNIYLFMVTRIVGGIAGYGRYLSSYILVMESVGPRLRARMGTYAEFGWSIGEMLQPGIYYFVRHFRHMQLMVTGFELVVCIVLFKLDESLRWQLTHGKYDEAREVILKAAAEKGELPVAQVESKLVRLKEFLDKDEESQKNDGKQTLFDMYRVPRLLKYCLILYLIWFFTSFVGYGMGLNIGDLAGSLFVNTFITAIAGAICKIGLLFIVDRLARRKLLCLSFIGAAASYMAMAFLTSADSIYMTSFAFLGSFFINSVFVLNYLYATEIFPTTVRQIGIGSCSILSRVGSISAPFVRELTQLTHLWVTLSTFAVMSMTAGCLVYFLPETQGKEIPDMISESKKIAERTDIVELDSTNGKNCETQKV